MTVEHRPSHKHTKNTRTHAHTHTCMHARMHACTQAHTHTKVAFAHTHTHHGRRRGEHAVQDDQGTVGQARSLGGTGVKGVVRAVWGHGGRGGQAQGVQQHLRQDKRHGVNVIATMLHTRASPRFHAQTERYCGLMRSPEHSTRIQRTQRVKATAL